MAPFRPLTAKPDTLVASSSEPLWRLNNRVVKQRRNHHTALDWESKKRTIIQLYTRENKQAKDVIEILRSEFAFNTGYVPTSTHSYIANSGYSRRQLFNKLNEWGVQKNKKRDAEYIQGVPEESGGGNSAIGLDNVVSGMANPSSGKFECRRKARLKLNFVLTRAWFS